jgi:hypothetical protein
MTAISTNDINDLVADPRNARKRTAQSKALLQESIKSFGAARSIVIDESNTILAGNGTVEAAAAQGINRVRIIETDGDEIIAVKRSGLSDADKVGLALADNRTSDLAEWDAQMLQSLAAEHDVTPWFSEDDINELLAKDDEFDPDDPTEDQSDKIDAVFQIIVNCRNEAEQTATLDYLLGQGLDCKAMNA